MGGHGEFHIADIILNASRQPANESVYSLGPYVGRISFLSQQYRAYNLVWALHERGKLLEGAQVAVIGGGLSGLTAAAAALAYGANVTVYEQARREISRQRNSRTRYVHPRINWWPQAGRDHLNPTTALPMLNWQSDICEDVSKAILQEWESLKVAYGGSSTPNRLNWHFGKVYSGAIKPGSAQGQTVVEINGEHQKEHFDLVILAMGFSAERGLEGSQTFEYWDNDNLEADREKAAHQAYVVSGFGDGGLIDALRLIFDFDWGRLAYRLALALHGTTIEAELAELSTDPIGSVRKDAKDRYEALVRKMAGAEALVKNTDSSEVVVKAAEPLANAWTMIRGAIRPRAPKTRIYICDKSLEHPIFGPSAPLYKLMIAMAEWDALVVVCKGEVEVRRPKVKKPAKAEDLVCIVCGDSAREIGPLSSTRVVLRHGADWEISKHVEEGNLAEMLREAAKLADHNYNPAWGRGFAYPTAQGQACAQRNLPGFIRQYAKRSQTALRSLASAGTLSPRIDGLRVFGHDIAYRPEHLFGVPLEYGNFGDTPEIDLD